jgi:hypothetical protein
MMERADDTEVHALTTMTREHLREIISSLVPYAPYRYRGRFKAEDRVLIMIALAVTNTTFENLHLALDVQGHEISEMIDNDLPWMGMAAERMWVGAVDSQADRKHFTYYPTAAFACDSTPLRCSNAEVINRFLSHALWSQKYDECCWKLMLLVTPNGQCVGWSLAPGRRNDKRILDEAIDIIHRITYVDLVGGEYVEKRVYSMRDTGASTFGIRRRT